MELLERESSSLFLMNELVTRQDIHVTLGTGRVRPSKSVRSVASPIFLICSREYRKLSLNKLHLPRMRHWSAVSKML